MIDVQQTADLIDRERTARGWTWKDLKKASGMAAACYCSRWRNGEGLPNLRTLECILNALGFEMVIRKMEDETP